MEEQIEQWCMLLEKLAFRANEAADALERLNKATDNNSHLENQNDFQGLDTMVIPIPQVQKNFIADNTAIMSAIK